MTQQKDFIEHFRRNSFGLDDEGRPSGLSEHLRSTMENLLGSVSKDLYSDDLHFVYELIQNAQDNSYHDGVFPNLKFVLLQNDPTKSDDSEGCLCVLNNEVGFSEADIKSICSAGESTKKLKKVEGFIGEKGIGFKSVFKVSKYPHIFSNGFHFKLLGEDKTTKLSYIIPYWVEELPDIVEENCDSTCILLPLQKGKYHDIHKSLKQHKPEVTLFLDKLKRVEIRILSDNYKAIFEEQLDGNTLTLTSAFGDEERQHQKFLLSSKQVTVPYYLAEEKREGVKKRTISIAFPLQKYNSLNVYGYLPTEMRSGLPFIINADFLLTANRESINKTKWNDWLFDEIAKFATAEIVRLARSEEIGARVYEFIPKDATGDRFTELEKTILAALRSEAFVKAVDGNLYEPTLVRSVTKTFRALFSHAEHKLNWLSEDLAGYYERLIKVGVVPLSKEEKEPYYYQTDFVVKQDDSWFINYYLFLAELPYRQFEPYPILPLENGGIEKVKTKATYSPVDLGDSISDISGHFFPPVKTLRKTLFNSIKSRQDSEKIFSLLSLKAFSYGDYFFNTVLPSVEVRTESSSIDDRKNLINFLLTWWDKLEVDSNRRLPNCGLPVLLDNNNLVLSVDFKNPFVVPEGFSGNTGWEVLFTSDEERAKLAVLNAWYSDVKLDSLDKYFYAAGVAHYPKPVIFGQANQSKLGGTYKKYDEYLNRAFFQSGKEEYSGIKSAKIPLLPTAFWNYESLSEQQYALLVAYLNSVISVNNFPKKPVTELFWFKGHKNLDYTISPFDIYLKETPWLKTTKGFQKPCECFIDDINLRQIFGNNLPYTTITASPEFLHFLGVKRDAATSTIIKYLQDLSGSDTPKVEVTTSIYNALRDRANLDPKEFSEKAIIFIPSINDKPAHWCTSAQVIWDDISDLTDSSTFESLAPHYPESLKEFFVSKLGVKESIDASSYAELWLNLQNKSILNDRDWALYCKAFANIRTAVRKEEKLKWLSNFRDNAKLYSDRNTWVSKHDEPEPFLPDQPHLREAFSNKLPFIKRISDHTYVWMAPLVKFLDFAYLSDVVEEQLISKKVDNLLPDNRYLTDYSIKLLVRLIANKVSEGREIAEKLKSNEKLAALLNFREAEVEHIDVKLFIPHTEIEILACDHTVFLDFDQKILFIKRNQDSDDIKDDLEKLIITRVLGDITNKQEKAAFEDSISKLLGISTKERHQKLINKRPDWHIPESILTFIDKIISERVPNKLEREPEGQAMRKVEDVDKQSTDTQRQTGSPTALDNRFFRSSEKYNRAPDQLDSDIDTGEEADSASEYQLNNSGSQKSDLSSFRSKIFSDNSSGGSTASSPNRSRSSNSTLRSKSARSQNTASNINQVRRNRLMSYVLSDLTESNCDVDNTDSYDQSEYRKKLGEKAELIVLEDLKVKGYLAERMPANNPGYDIEAENPETGELLFIEVKGDSHGWSDKGVGISARQYHAATDKKGSYYLAVVDNLASAPSAPIYICDPVSCITEYRFDSGWAELAAPIKTVSKGTPEKSALENMLQYTDQAECHSLLKYCDQMNYPLPDIGTELQDEKGKVVLENIELLWENERVIVFIDSDSFNDAQDYRNDWHVFLAEDQEGIKTKLDEIFGARD